VSVAQETVEWRRLSNRMLVVHPVQELIRLCPVLIGLVFAGNAGGHGSWWSLIGTGVTIAFGVMRWFTTTYSVTDAQVQVRKGLVRRQVLTIPRDRIRSVDVTANALHRALGLARVKVGTGRSDRKDDDLKLDALSAVEAARLHEELLHRPATASSDAAEGPRETLIAAVPGAWVRYGPFSLMGLVAVGVVTGLTTRILDETHVDPGQLGPLSALLDRWEKAAVTVEILAAAVALLLAVAVASTVGYVLAFYRFRLTRNSAGTLHITRGLITTRAITIEERRLRGVEFSEPLLLRAVRGARCIAITTGLRVGAEVLGHATPLTCTLTPHGARATRRRFTRALGTSAAVVALSLIFWAFGAPAWGWHLSLILLPAAALLAFDRAHALGHALTDETLVSRRGSLVRRRSALACEGIIGWNLQQSFFQRRGGMATLVATTAAGRQRVDVQDVTLEEALNVADKALPGLLAPFLER
jgi:putative membrane protein